MKKRKRIAVLIAQPDSHYQKALLEGVTSEAFGYDMDVLVFSSFVKKADKLYLRGEQAIYEALECNNVDAIIVVPDTIQIEGVSERILDNLKKRFHGPVIVVDMDSDSFYSIHNDDALDMKQIINHLIEVHQYRRIAFLAGPKDHQHSKWRIAGYKESLSDHQIPYDENLVFYGDFWFASGPSVVERIMAMEPRPQAIACASEVMAMSVCEALISNGFRVPEDIAVTGFDPYGTELHSNYQITTIPRSAKTLGVNAARHLIGLIEGVVLPQEKGYNDIMIYGTCGCPYVPKKEYAVWAATTEGKSCKEVVESFYSIYNFMLEDIIGEQDLKSSLFKIMYYTRYLSEFSNFYICLNENWIDRTEEEKSAYSNRMIYALALHEHDEDHCFASLDTTFPRWEMLPDLDKPSDKPSIYYFSPIHFNGVSFGYSVISYEGEFRVYPNFYMEWLRKVNNGLESQRRQARLQAMYELMEKNAVKDMLTDVYNRNGFNLYGPKIFEQAKKEDKKLLILVGDVNDTKYINDTFGHLEGDEAIKITADAFISQTDQELNQCKVFRIGGDEFVMMSIGNYDQEQVQNKMDEIVRKIQAQVKISNKKYEVSVSLGAYCDYIPQELELKNMFAYADAQMYESKSLHRLKNQSRRHEIIRTQ